MSSECIRKEVETLKALVPWN